NLRAISNAMGRLALESADRADLCRRGLQRASDFSWQTTAQLTLDAYREVADARGARRVIRPQAGDPRIVEAINRTLAYAALFDYPLKSAELRDRLFDVEVDEATFSRVLAEQNLPRYCEYLDADSGRAARREEREMISDRAVGQAWPRLSQLAAVP